MLQFIQKNILTIAGIFIGALAGYLYWQYVGCLSGTCAITSNPKNSTLYGAMMGGLVFSLFQPNTPKNKANNTINKQ